MRNLVQVVHPHTYKYILEDGQIKFEIGPSNEANKPRDEKVASFLKEAKKSGSEILVHLEYMDNFMGRAMQRLAFKADPIYEDVVETIEDCFFTLHSGLPLPRNRPEKIDKKSWDFLRRNIISHSGLKRRIPEAENVFFMGGLLEACLGNFTNYYSMHYSTNGQKLFLIEDLAASLDENEAKKIKGILGEGGINFVNYNTAMSLLK